MCIALILGLLRNLVFGKMLTPEEMGYYSIALTISSYGMLFQLGIINGLGRELPVVLGQKNNTHASNLVGVSTIILCLLQVLGIIIYSVILLTIPFNDEKMRSVFLWGGILALSIPFSQIVMLRLRSEQRVLAFSIAQVVSSALILLIGIITIQYLSYLGAIGSIIIINFLIYIVISQKHLNSVNYSYFNLKSIKYLMKIGIPLMLAGVLLNLQISMDRLFLIQYFSIEQIGIYQISIIPITLGTATSGIISQYVSPKLLFRFGEGKSITYVFSKVKMVSFITIGIMGLFIPFVFWGAKFIIYHWLPAYSESIELITIFYIGAIFISANIIGLVYNVANKQMLQLYLGMFIVLLSLLGYTFVSYYKMQMVWYAYVNTSSQIIYFFLNMVICFYLTKKPR